MMLALLLACPNPQGSESGKDTVKLDSDTGVTDSDSSIVDSDTGDTDSGMETGEDSDTSTCENTYDTSRTFAVPTTCDRSLGWTDVTAGLAFTCGVRSDGCAECWGVWVDFQAYTPPGESFVSVATSNTGVSGDYGRVCGQLSTGDGVCWGGRNFSGPSISPEGRYSAVTAGGAYGYGLGDDGRLVTWMPGYDECQVGPYITIAANDGGYAAVDTAGSVRVHVAFGNNVYPTGVWTSFSMGFSLACGIRADLDGAITCVDAYYGTEVDGMPAEQASTGFLDVCVAGNDEACALDASGIPVCWNTMSTFSDLLSPPPGPFTKITCGSRHACGLTAEGAIACWGNDVGGETTPPS